MRYFATINDPVRMPSISAAQRQKHIIDVLKVHGHATVSKLSSELDVSEVTIRKDLQVLDDRKLLVRTHGGAVLMDHYLYDLPFDEKSRVRVEEKRRIGKQAAELVHDGQTLVMNAGSTTVQVARHIRGRKNLTIATNALFVAVELLNNLDVEILALGGILHSTTGATVGPEAENMLRKLTFDYLFLAGDGFDIEHGITTTNVLEAHLSQAMILSARCKVVVMDSTKFGRRGLTRVCDVREVDVVITDEGVPDETRSALEDIGLRFIIV
ncbi:MAG: DeoR/GlpR transcriptional regulator [Rhodothermaceae bacterium]|nr:DeoR/GlpR transcriptional regulator [Rhodothermaceae bacterium]